MLTSQPGRALFIGLKDIESYYGKPPLITWALLFPGVLMLALYVKDPTGYRAVAPGIVAMTLLFGNTSMAAIVVTFEKRSGTFQRLLLAPVSHRTILLGKATSAAAYGIATSLVLTFGLSLLLEVRVSRPFIFSFGLLCGAWTFSLSGLIAAVMVREVFEAMTLLNFFRFPILFISGIFVPLGAFPGWAKPLCMLSPMTFLVELLRFGMFGRSYFASPFIPAAALLGFSVTAWLLAEMTFRRRASR